MNDDALGQLTARAAELKGLEEQAKVSLKRISDNLNEINEKILNYLQLAELDNVKAHGYLFFQRTSSSVSTPKTEDEKKALFDFLQEKEIFYEFASVNSQSLNSLYKNLAEEALQDGILEFEMPGVGKPSSYTTLQMRKSK